MTSIQRTIAKKLAASDQLNMLFRKLDKGAAKWFLHKGYLDTPNQKPLVFFTEEPQVTEPTLVLRYSSFTPPVEIGNGKAILPGVSKIDATYPEYDIVELYPNGRMKVHPLADHLQLPENRKEFYYHYFE